MKPFLAESRILLLWDAVETSANMRRTRIVVRRTLLTRQVSKGVQELRDAEEEGKTERNREIYREEK
jgi:hypothetical protein